MAHNIQNLTLPLFRRLGQVMGAYIESLNFPDMELDEAIRLFLSGFRLPGEAQKIDRLMEKFAERYCGQNPGRFKNADTAYVLSYSVIMLNTDLHNPMVKQKMTKAEFIKNNRGIDDGNDMPEDVMGALYDRILHNEIKMKDFGAHRAREVMWLRPPARPQETRTVLRRPSSVEAHSVAPAFNAGHPGGAGGDGKAGAAAKPAPGKGDAVSIFDNTNKLAMQLFMNLIPGRKVRVVERPFSLWLAVTSVLALWGAIAVTRDPLPYDNAGSRRCGYFGGHHGGCPRS